MQVTKRYLHRLTGKGREREVAQSCPTLCDLMDCGLLGSSIHGIFQARVLEWVSIAFSKINREQPFKYNQVYTHIKIQIIKYLT